MRQSKKPLVVALSAAFALTGAPAFAAVDLASGYQVASLDDHKCGADKKAGEHKCGEHKCGEGKCGADKKAGEHKCGEGKCGAEKKPDEPKK